MKTLTYEYKKMVRAGQILNALPFCGIEQARLISELGDILDSGLPGEIMEKEENRSDSNRNVQNERKGNVE